MTRRAAPDALRTPSVCPARSGRPRRPGLERRGSGRERSPSWYGRTARRTRFFPAGRCLSRGPSFRYLCVLRVVFRSVPRPLPSALLTALALALPAAGRDTARPPETLATFHTAVRPILEKHCYDCHGNGISKGGVTLDAFASDAEVTARPELWHAVLRNVQAGLMPAHEEGVARPSPEELRTLAGWIKYGALGIDPADPDPGHVTVRRLNRA
ncbi:MAG: hypothetical protein FJ381_13495, partial [Verrucomicrobia bacterium]|nr:hypothetical protein [Verrucomicrobiota bacterium]